MSSTSPSPVRHFTYSPVHITHDDLVVSAIIYINCWGRRLCRRAGKRRKAVHVTTTREDQLCNASPSREDESLAAADDQMGTLDGAKLLVGVPQVSS